MDNMEYYTQRLQCSDAEKDACLETVVKIFWLRYEIRKMGWLVAEMLAEEEPDPFFRACLMDLADVPWDPKELERRYTQYLMAGDCRGGAFLNAVLISQGLVLLLKYQYMDHENCKEWPAGQSWVDALGGTLRGYFGVEYREKVTEVIWQEEKNRVAQLKWSSMLPEFDDLIKLSPQQRDWLVRNVSESTLRYALKVGGSEVSKFLMEGLEDREKFEQDLEVTCNVLAKDVEAAQREILEKAKEIPECM